MTCQSDNFNRIQFLFYTWLKKMDKPGQIIETIRLKLWMSSTRRIDNSL